MTRRTRYLRRERGRRFAFAFMAAALAVLGGIVASEELRVVGDALERPGIEDFYAQPAGAAMGAPGTIVKSDALWGAPFASRAWRIMYRTADVHGDAARAARAMPDADAGDRVVLWGHSQGGQAVLFAAQRAAEYAPELDIRAVAAAAPAANLPGLMSAHLDDVSGVTIGSYAFTSYAQVYPGAPLEGILTPTALTVVPTMNEMCLLTNIADLHRIGQPLVGDFTTSDPTTTQPWATLFAENSAGAVPFDAPLFLAQGLKDELVVPRDTAAFAAQETAHGMDVTYHEIPIATHGTVAYLALPALLEWLDRLDTR